MSNTKCAAIAAVVAALAASPIAAEAANNGLTNQVRTLVKREVAKIKRGPRGPAGPAGPPGTPGPQGLQGIQGAVGPGGAVASFSSLFAFIEEDRVVPSQSSGITEENLRVEYEFLEDYRGQEPILITTYCFIGLPPVMGGQVAINGEGGYAAVVSPKIEINTAEGCGVRVSIHGLDRIPDVTTEPHRPGFNLEPPLSADFYLLLY